MADWQRLTRLAAGARLQVERVRLLDSDSAGVAIEGAFELPALAQLTAEDQIFIAAFVRCHGSIKQMEKFFGVSYPTIKNRLNRIGERLPFADVAPPLTPSTSSSELLTELERGDITAREAIARLRGDHDDDRG